MPQNKQENTSFRRHRPFYKTPVFSFSIVAIVVVGATIAVIHFSKEPDAPILEPTSTSVSTDKETKSTEETKEENKETKTDAEASSSSSVSPDGKTPTQYDGDNPNLDNSLTGFLSTARFSNDKLIIRVVTDQYLSSGTCTLVLSDGANRLEKTARLIPDASTSTCEGFDIANFELTSFTRPINVEINLLSGDKSGTINGSVE